MSKHHSHPCEHLAEKLKGLSMSSAALARHIRVPTNRVSQILSGKRSVTADTALRLGKCLNTEPEYWLNLQIQYELDIAEHAVNAELMSIAPLLVTTDACDRA